MRAKYILALLLLAHFAFATTPGWTSAAFIAIAASAAIVGTIYAIGTGFSMNDLKMLAQEEFYQLLMTAVIIGLLFGAEAAANSLFKDFGPTLQDAGLTRINATLDEHFTAFNNVKAFAVVATRESSKSSYCSISGAGFSISPCGSFSALTTPAAMSMQALGLSITELASLKTLMRFSKSYAFAILLPLGILLRALHFSRGAGGLFIGLAVSLYFFLPVAVILMDDLTSPAPTMSKLPSETCNVHAFATAVGAFNYANADKVKGEFNTLLGNISGYLYEFLVRGTLTLLVSLLAFFASFRWVSKLAGAEVDISALSRIA